MTKSPTFECEPSGQMAQVQKKKKGKKTESFKIKLLYEQSTLHCTFTP